MRLINTHCFKYFGEGNIPKLKYVHGLVVEEIDEKTCQDCGYETCEIATSRAFSLRAQGCRARKHVEMRQQ